MVVEAAHDLRERESSLWAEANDGLGTRAKLAAQAY